MQILRAAVLSFCAFMMQPAMADEVETTLDNFRTAGAGDLLTTLMATQYSPASVRAALALVARTARALCIKVASSRALSK